MNEKIAAEIQIEQDHGRAKYGNAFDDFAHDDAHIEIDWHNMIDDHNERGRHETPMERRQRLVKIAGLAVSAIEAHDRKYFARLKRK